MGVPGLPAKPAVPTRMTRNSVASGGGAAKNVMAIIAGLPPSKNLEELLAEEEGMHWRSVTWVPTWADMGTAAES